MALVLSRAVMKMIEVGTWRQTASSSWRSTGYRPLTTTTAKSKATNVVDHWGGAHPPSALQCVGYRVVHVGIPKCNDIIHLKESKISKEHKGIVYNLHSRSLFRTGR